MRSRAWVQIAAATLSSNSFRQTVHTHRASVRQSAKLVAALLKVVGVTAGLAESNGSLPPGLWLTSPAGWLPRTGISSGTHTLCNPSIGYIFTFFSSVQFMCCELSSKRRRCCWLCACQKFESARGRATATQSTVSEGSCCRRATRQEQSEALSTSKPVHKESEYWAVWLTMTQRRTAILPSNSRSTWSGTPRLSARPMISIFGMRRVVLINPVLLTS